MSFADQLTVARAISVPIVVALFAIPFPNHDLWATGVFCAAMATDWFDGRVARRTGRTSSFGSLLDPVADKLLVMATLIVLLDQDVFPAWMVAAIVARELLISGLRQAAIERGVVIAARDLGKLKTWSQALAAALGGLAAAEVVRTDVGPDVGLRPRLRPLGAAGPPWPRGRLPVTRAPH
jgi:CDP-diacylglycerol--glycerol-3-phosphate 3-phosphatidyltransferase